MVVDRGGLNYPIRVIDEFSANTQKFRDEIRRSREEFIKFRRSSRLLNQQVSKDQKTATRALATARKDAKNEQRDRLNNVNAGIKQQKELEKLRARASQDVLSRTRALAALETKASATREKASAKAAKASKVAAGSGVILRRSLVRQESAASKLLFTFRRLVGVLALFTIARQVSQGFGALVKSGFAFNQTIERSRLGIAGIITAVGKVKDEQGKVVKGAQAFAIATGLARKQQSLLQRDALLTTATFEELLNVFQIATGPGLAAGLNLDQIRKISILVSQAASAIDLPQNQLSEEIRALLTGNIRTTTTRIAQVLNLTPSDVKGAIRQGELYELLTNRLAGFALAAEKTAQTVGGLASRIKGAIQVIAGEASVKGFGTLRVVLGDIFKSLLIIKRDSKGVIDSFKLNPNAVKPFTAIFDAIDNIIKTVAQLGTTIGFDGLTAAAEGFGAVLQIIGEGIAVILAGTVSGFGNLSTILLPIIDLIRGLGESIDSTLGSGTIQGLLATIVQLGIVVLGLGVGLKIASFALGFVQKGFARVRSIALFVTQNVGNLIAGTKIWVKETRAGAAAWRALKSPVTLFVGLLAAAFLATGFILEDAFGMKLTFSQVGRLIGISLVDQFKKASLEMQILTSHVVSFFGIFDKSIRDKKGVVGAALDDIGSGILLEVEGLLRLAGASGTADKLRQLQVNKQLKDDDIRAAADEDRVEKGFALRKELQDKLNANQKKFQEEINVILKEGLDPGAIEQARIARLAAIEKLTLGSAGPPDKDLTEDEKKAFRRDKLRVDFLQIRANLETRLAKLDSRRISSIDKDIRASKLRTSALRAEIALRQRALQDEVNKAVADANNERSELRKVALMEAAERLIQRRNILQQQLNSEIEREEEFRRKAGIEGRGSLAVGRERIAQAKRESDFAIALLQSDRAREFFALGSATSDAEKTVILERIHRLNIAITTQKLLQEQAAERALFQMQFTAAQARGEAFEGLKFGFLSFAEEFKNSFDAAVEIAQASIARLAEFISTVISDAFDPNKDQSIKERLGNFLKDISKIIINALTKLAIAKLILGFSGPSDSFGSSAANIPFFGSAAGGRIPSHRTQASVAHYARPQGLAGGGRPTPPKGIDRRDTTPIWAQPGEFMMRLSAVKKYGIGVMNAINTGAMDPTSLASMTGARRMSRNTKRTVGFAVGGEVSNAGQTVAAATGGNEGGGIGIGLLVANEQTAERFLAGGKKAFLDFIDENGADIDGRLARFRS